ncbi:polyprenyl synthetase family protein [Actinomadura sp. DC4]|uniref:polyprenyl synthetase family protein n=1 Tax=Actinomadura sp. DC4 TaxID=3055069 RepID=UPI0025AF8D01|nr:polyprenyl synthetase family protein [Actinomadura sp. DC4]MDN3354011.1 polyprenyl synthetase family protein [Actinomadura sp. DC4]
MSSGLLGLPAVDDTLAADISGRLDSVEDLLRSSVESEHSLLRDASRHLAEAGGKRFRPMLVLLAAEFGDRAAPGVVPAAVVVELTHLATLYHDDVMDEAVMRRGEASANSRWDNTVAILTGDYLFARASDILADLGPEAVRIQARTFARLVQGQIEETTGPPEGTDALNHYLGVVAGKTGSLIAASGHLGALLAGAEPAVVTTLTSVCEKIGIAFQLSDDILDVASESDESGKTPGTDLREGVHTLPVLHVLRSAAPGDEHLRSLLLSDLSEDDARHAEALTLLRAHPAMDRARADLRQWVDDAHAELATLPDLPARTAFMALCDYVLTRTS